MKILTLKLALITALVGLFNFGFAVEKTNNHQKTEKNLKIIDTVFISYDNLPPFVKEFLYKGYKVRPDDIQSIAKIKDGAYLVQMNRSFNVFGINKLTKNMQNQKLDFFKTNMSLQELQRLKRSTRNTSRISEKRTRTVRIASTPKDIEWSTLPLQVKEYLIKRMKASESQVYKVIDLGNDSYKIILKRAYNYFVIFKDSPDRIALEHIILNNLD